jgi:hypothetical protein
MLGINNYHLLSMDPISTKITVDRGVAGRYGCRYTAVQGGQGISERPIIPPIDRELP